MLKFFLNRNLSEILGNPFSPIEFFHMEIRFPYFDFRKFLIKFWNFISYRKLKVCRQIFYWEYTRQPPSYSNPPWIENSKKLCLFFYSKSNLRRKVILRKNTFLVYPNFALGFVEEITLAWTNLFVTIWIHIAIFMQKFSIKFYFNSSPI